MSIWDASVSTANWVYGIAWIGLISGAIVTAVSTMAIFWASGVRDKHADTLIAQAQASSDEAKAAAALANARAAEANQKAKEADLARVRLEEKLAPRRLTQEQLTTIAEKMKSWAKLTDGHAQSAAVFPFPPNFESSSLAGQIISALETAGWKINTYPVTYAMPIGAVSGVGILTSSNSRGIAVANSLVEALRAEGIHAGIIDIKRRGCEEMGYTQEAIDSNPSCSSIQCSSETTLISSIYST